MKKMKQKKFQMPSAFKVEKEGEEVTITVLEKNPI